MTSTRLPQGSASTKQTRNKLALVLLVITVIAVIVPAASAQTYTVLHSFAGPPTDGATPLAGVVMDASGNLWGTTSIGGTQNRGTIFMLTPEGTIKTYSFTGESDGEEPQAGLLLYHGAFYGTTLFGGDYNNGVVFKLDSINHLTVLHTFTGEQDGSNPAAGLVADPAGNLYGTAQEGGDLNCSTITEETGCGTVFKLDINGNFTVLYSFAGFRDGMFPNSTMVLDTAGNLYGTTEGGGNYRHDNRPCTGSAGCGTIFKLDTAGKKTTLHRFAGTDGAFPMGVIKIANTLYGTTESGVGASRLNGRVFALSPEYGLTTLYNFTDPTEGANPYANLTAGNHSLYGTTQYGGFTGNDVCAGFYGCGVVFQFDATGMKTLHAFNGSDGRWPEASLLVDAAGNIYGTTISGGDYGYGVVFKITPQ